jgi:hypothetical protein
MNDAKQHQEKNDRNRYTEQPEDNGHNEALLSLSSIGMRACDLLFRSTVIELFNRFNSRAQQSAED